MAVTLTSGDMIADRRYQWALASLEEGDGETAAELLAGVTELAPGFAPAWFELGRVRRQLGDAEASSFALRRYLAIEPQDRLGAGLILAELGRLEAGAAIAPAYVEALFDDYAGRFDAHLTGTLGYRGPQILLQALERHRPAPLAFGLTLDLGCGTGLMARALAGAARRMVGVDLSAGMLAQARETGLYESLHKADIVTFLEHWPEPAELIVAADVLVYLGPLEAALAGVAGRLELGGLFAFTVQALEGEGFALGPDARYAHSDAYLRACAEASGLRVREIASASTRTDSGRPVPGFVCVLEAA